jgi:hypothetical protein
VSATWKRAQRARDKLNSPKPVKQESGLFNPARLLGFGKMKDFDLGLNSEPFADIPDDEVVCDLEMLMREMGQAPPTAGRHPAGGPPRAAPPPPLPRGHRRCVSAPLHVENMYAVCVVLLYRGSCVAVCAPGVVVVVMRRAACHSVSVAPVVSVQCCLTHTSLTPPRSAMCQCVLCSVCGCRAAAVVSGCCRVGGVSRDAGARSMLPAVPHTPLCRSMSCTRRLLTHTRLPRTVQCSATAVVACGQWTTRAASTVPYLLFSAIVMTIMMLAYSSMPPSLSVATGKGAVASHVICDVAGRAGL